jgi:hypothetical protein
MPSRPSSYASSRPRGGHVAKDTRERGDDYGYRAVHVVATLDGRFAEVQIRTVYQDVWAQLVERTDKTLGTGPEESSGTNASSGMNGSDARTRSTNNATSSECPTNAARTLCALPAPRRDALVAQALQDAKIGAPGACAHRLPH